MRQLKYVAEYVRGRSKLRLEVTAISLLQAVESVQEHNRKRRHEMGIPSDYRVVAFIDPSGQEVRF